MFAWYMMFVRYMMHMLSSFASFRIVCRHMCFFMQRTKSRNLEERVDLLLLENKHLEDRVRDLKAWPLSRIYTSALSKETHSVACMLDHALSCGSKLFKGSDCARFRLLCCMLAYRRHFACPRGSHEHACMLV